VRDILGKTVIIHGSPDDFTSQPAGNAGQKIACGEIRPATV
jgi:Cu-Zn family superoxide dismutase